MAELRLELGPVLRLERVRVRGQMLEPVVGEEASDRPSLVTWHFRSTRHRRSCGAFRLT